jgi:HPt (histidine-containing phosphotransfer) domain-containing protein
MEAANIPNPFIFNQKIDANHLLGLYENDYGYMEEIFKTVCDHYEDDLTAVKMNYDVKDLTGLRKAVHKLKPVFGFIGMPDVQEMCLQLEQSCGAVSGTEELSDKIKKLVPVLEESGIIIRQEYEKLVSFNKTRL